MCRSSSVCRLPARRSRRCPESNGVARIGLHPGEGGARSLRYHLRPRRSDGTRSYVPWCIGRATHQPDRDRRYPVRSATAPAASCYSNCGDTDPVDSEQYLRRGVKPWPRRLHLALNYLPLIIGGILLCLAVLIAGDVTNLAVALGVLAAWVLAITEVLGRRPYVRRVGSQLRVRNLLRAHEVSTDSMTGVRLHTFRLGKDTCPAIKTTDRTIPVLAYFGSEVDVLAADLGVLSDRHNRRLRGHRAAKARRTSAARRRS